VTLTQTTIAELRHAARARSPTRPTSPPPGRRRLTGPASRRRDCDTCMVAPLLAKTCRSLFAARNGVSRMKRLPRHE